MEEFLKFFRGLFGYDSGNVNYTENHPTLTPEEDLRQDIVANTFIREKDGTNVGYSYLDANHQNSQTPSYFEYREKNGKVSNLKKLSPEEQKAKIYNASGNTVAVNEIDDQNYLANLMKTMFDINRTTDVLRAPGETTINVLGPEDREYETGETIGVARPSSGQIVIRNPDYSRAPLERQPRSYNVDRGWWTTANTTLHELGHMSDPNLGVYLDEQYRQKKKENEKYRGKYSVGDIIANLFYNAGVPLRQIIKGATGINLGGTDFSELSDDSDLEHERNIVLEKEYQERQRELREDLMAAWRSAVQKTGFENTNQAIESISEYGGSSTAEGFAEAYADVVQNGENAKPFSKALFLEMEKVARKYLPPATAPELAERQLAVKSWGSQGDLDLDRLLQIKTSFR